MSRFRRLRRAGARHMAPLLLTAGFTLSLVAWVVANPPFAAPDEPSHYSKAVAAGRGDLLGTPGPFGGEERLFTPAQRRQVDRTIRAFSVPRDLRYQSSLPCFAFMPNVTADCLAADVPRWAGDPTPSIVGSYQPFLYVPPGLLTRLANDRLSAVLLARAGTAVLSVALLAMAVWLLWGPEPSGRNFAMIGLVLAVTPMVLFMASEIGGSGPEIAGGVAVTAGVLRLSRSPGPPARSVWVLVGLAGLFLGLSRPVAPLWLAVEAALLLALLGARRLWSMVRASGPVAVLAVIVPAAAAVMNVAWGTYTGMRTPILWSQLPDSIRSAVGRLKRSSIEAIGSFGWQDTDLPKQSYVIWFAFLALLVTLALVVGTPRHRLVLVGTVTAAVASSVFVGTLLAQNEQALLGRYMLPVAVAVPMLAGEIVARNQRHRLVRPAQLMVIPVAASVAGLQLLSWLVNSRRYAVGRHGTWWFVPEARWSPPGGWWPWIFLAVAAAAMQALSALFFPGPAADLERTEDDGRMFWQGRLRG